MPETINRLYRVDTYHGKTFYVFASDATEARRAVRRSYVAPGDGVPLTTGDLMYTDRVLVLQNAERPRRGIHG